MRLPKIKTLAVALSGMALFASEPATAGDPSNCAICNTLPATARVRGPHSHKTKRIAAHLCADCAVKMESNGMVPPTMVAAAPGGCTACGTSGPVTSGPMSSSPMPSAPGYAMVGDGSPSPLLAAGGNAPGYAIVGGTMVSSEPAPVGVMQTNYSTGSMPQGTLGASIAGNHGGGMPGMSGAPFAQPNEVPPSLYAPPKRRSSIIARVIGLPDFGRRRAEAEVRRRENHAMTSYGSAGSAPSELPASAVYGGR